MPNLTIRYANEKDTAVILKFIRRLAEYEKLDHHLTATEEDIRVTLFDKKQAEVIIAQANDTPVGFALFFRNYSTFLGKANVFLEDLYVSDEYRGMGIGTKMLQYLAKISIDSGGQRLDWLCLDNNLEAVEFYKNLGAEILDDRRVFRLSKDNLKDFAYKKQKKRGDKL